MERDYTAEIAQYVDNMRIKKQLGGFDKLDTYHHMQELGKRCAEMMEAALLEKQEIINGLKNELSQCQAREKHPDLVVQAAERQAKLIIEATYGFVQHEQQAAQRIFQDKMMEQQRAVNELEARKKELKLELSKLEVVIREIKAGLGGIGNQLGKIWTTPNQESSARAISREP